MITLKRDPLLVIARFMLIASMAIMVIGGTIMALAIPGMLVMRSGVLSYLTKHGSPAETFPAIVGMLALGVIALTLGFYFFRQLYRIVGSVGEGDPFVPINAQRLQWMGWITVAVHIITIPIAALAHWLESLTDQARIQAELPASGFLLAIILFILARVFRRGTQMRDELEGTV